jgi:hypothetical protein
MHKKLVYPLIIMLLALALASCSSTSDETTADNGQAPNGTGQPARTISEDLQLMMGTVLLDKTDYAIDANQAADLIPIWKLLDTMAGSETSAQVEVDAVIASIQDAMTPEQMTAIKEMNLTMADMNEVFQTLGIEMNGGGGGFGQMTEEQQATMEAMRNSGDFPQGGPGGSPGMGAGGGMGRGGGEFGGDTGITPQMRETAMAERENGLGRGFGINTQLLEAIITFLEAK